MATVVASYPESNHALELTLYTGAYYRRSQAFRGSQAGNLDSAKFNVCKGGSPTGSVYAKVWSHNGTYGSNSTGGTLLSTSDAVDISTLPTTPTRELKTFTFSGAERISLSASPTAYCVTIEYDAGTVGNYLGVSGDNTSPTHPGTYARYSVAATWESISGLDMCFYVLVDSATLDEPTNVSAAIVSATGIEISWQHGTISTAASFEVQRQLDGGTWTTI